MKKLTPTATIALALLLLEFYGTTPMDEAQRRVELARQVLRESQE